jgi:hypothetical protein
LKNINLTIDLVLRAKQVKALNAFYRDGQKQFRSWMAGGCKQAARPLGNLPFPKFCRGMKQEAKTCSGHPCKNDGTNWANGRCKYHGGASTGPVTPEGKNEFQ